MDSELVILHFPSTAEADQALSTVRGLDAEGFLSLEDSAIVTRDDEGWVNVRPSDPGEPAKKSALGGALGLVVGGLIGLPVLGVLAGAGIAAKAATHSDRLEELVSTVGENMTAGTCVLVLRVTSLEDPEIVAERVQIHRDRMIRAEVPEALDAQLDEYR